MRLVVLGSGSAGNSLLIAGPQGCFLVDAGLSARQIEGRLEAVGVAPRDLAGVLLTHEHVDHTAGLRVLLKRWRMPCYCNGETAHALQGLWGAGSEVRVFQNGQDFAIAGVSARAFAVPHDAADPVGFRFEAAGCACAVLTDLGYTTRLVCEAVRGVQALVIETNYDDDLLQRDRKRPWPVKQRIASRHGHLSNADAAAFLATIEAPGLEAVVLAHLSRDCNAPELAIGAVRTTLAASSAPPHIFCAPQEAPSAEVLLAVPVAA